MELLFLAISVICAFLLGFYLERMRTRSKNEGVIRISEEEDGRKVFSLELDVDPDDIERMKQISFKVAGRNGSS